jgi:hypothetical protein
MREGIRALAAAIALLAMKKNEWDRRAAAKRKGKKA